MNRNAISLSVFLIASLSMVNCMMNTLTEKTVIAKTTKNDKKCLDLLKNNSTTPIQRCEFFKCFEEKFPCGSEYWIINWGYKYCRRYADAEFIAKFTPTGKKLLDHVNKCLPKHFEKTYKKKRIRCKSLNTEAFDSQGKCYEEVQKDFCKAFPENKDLFIKVLDHGDFLNFESIGMIKKVADKCTPKIDFMSFMSG